VEVDNPDLHICFKYINIENFTATHVVGHVIT